MPLTQCDVRVSVVAVSNRANVEMDNVHFPLRSTKKVDIDNVDIGLRRGDVVVRTHLSVRNAEDRKTEKGKSQ